MKLIFAIIRVFFIFIVFLGKYTKSTKLRILGGRQALPSEFPYVVSFGLLLYDTSGRRTKVSETASVYRTVCSASVITPRWSLTAAHCLKPVLLYQVFILRDDEFVRVYQKKTYHHRFKVIQDLEGRLLSVSNDIGIMNHDTINITEYGRLSALEYMSLYGSPAVAAGYGLGGVARNMSYNGTAALSDARHLMTLNVVVIKCDHTSETVSYPAICTGAACSRSGYSTVCHGDSGGPLIHQSGIIAVASAAMPCDEEQTKSQSIAGSYTPVSPYLKWIRTKVFEVT